MGHEVKLEVFEGPIDLLLHLVTRRRVDIYDVSLASITDEYLTALDGLEGLDLEAATGFLVIAAALLELKSARLLPGPDLEEDDGLLEQRDLLLARLVECSTFREAGSWMAGALERGGLRHGRTAGLEPQFLNPAPDLLERVGVVDLARAGAIALHRPAPPVLDTAHVAPIRASVADAVVDLAGRLQDRGWRSFEELCAGAAGRIEVVVRFLGVLELYKAGAVEVEQAGRFGDIRVVWTGEADLGVVLAGVEEYSLKEPA